MSLPDAVIDAMVNAGCTAEQLAAAIKAANAEGDERRERKRANNVERQRRYRERHAGDDNARNALPSVTERDSVTDPALSPSPFLSPQTPQTNPHPHTHPDIYTPRVKGGDFPMLDCTDPATWADFRANRKAKRLPCTPSAHAKLIRDLETMSARLGWPPGEVFRACVERGWGAIYDPTEGEVKQNGRQQHHSNRESASDIARRLANVAQAERNGPLRTG